MTMFPWGQAIGLAGSLASGGLQSGTKYKGRTKKYIKNQIQPGIEQSFGKQQDLLRSAMNAQVGGYQSALNETQDIGAMGARRILEQQRMASGQIDQNLASRGLGGTTVQNSLQRGLRESTQRLLSENDQRFAAMRAQLQTGRGTAEAQGLRSLAQNYGLKFQATSSLVYGSVLGINSGGRVGTQFANSSQGADFSGISSFIDDSLMPWIQGLGKSSSGG